MSKNKPKFKSRVFADKFRELLSEVPDACSLPEWQQLYRELIFTTGMHILEKFPEDATRERRPQDKHASGGSGGGGHPSVLPCRFVDFPAFVLCLTPESPAR
ncbi:MAG: hypothetical protein ABSD02_11440 [Steroidobacteraceae bacterium]